uniref:putative integrase/recombinase protein,partial n=1 Tax=Symbiochloris sp. SG-2018 TaxID=2126034 RepID=UPI0021143EF7|nr:putative integrase/recombinase protein,partial [Symbiochloris sp. SG-2018]UTQ75686.1 putative integrase/recombinase protein,partial [Symbiochloris sp. SG-2018]
MYYYLLTHIFCNYLKTTTFTGLSLRIKITSLNNFKSRKVLKISLFNIKNKLNYLLAIKPAMDVTSIPVITPVNSTKPIGRTLLTARINSILKETGRICHKKFSSHSFLIELTTSIIETSGVDAAQLFIGHTNIATTAMDVTSIYNRRNNLTKKVLSKFLKKTNEKTISH